MGTYDLKQILNDYANDKITPEMAVGHALQHIKKLYELQTNANINRYELRDQMNTVQIKIAQLNTRVEKIELKQKPSKS